MGPQIQEIEMILHRHAPEREDGMVVHIRTHVDPQLLAHQGVRLGLASVEPDVDIAAGADAPARDSAARVRSL